MDLCEKMTHVYVCMQINYCCFIQKQEIIVTLLFVISCNDIDRDACELCMYVHWAINVNGPVNR